MNKKERFNKAFSFLKYEGVIKTQDDVARKMGASRSNISSALNGKGSVLTDNFLRRFANAFKQISLNWLLEEQGPMTTIVPEFKDENRPQVLEGNVDKDVIAEQYKMTERIRELIHETGHLPKTFALEANIEVNNFLNKMKGMLMDKCCPYELLSHKTDAVTGKLTMLLSKIGVAEVHDGPSSVLVGLRVRLRFESV